MIYKNKDLLSSMIWTKYLTLLREFTAELKTLSYRPIYSLDLVPVKRHWWQPTKYRLNDISTATLVRFDSNISYPALDSVFALDDLKNIRLIHIDELAESARPLLEWFVTRVECLYADFRYALKAQKLKQFGFTLEHFVDMYDMNTYKNTKELLEKINGY